MENKDLKNLEESVDSSIEETTVESISSNHNNDDKNSRKKFKLPSALSIILGVVVFAILVTWITYLVSGGDSSWYTLQEGKQLSTNFNEFKTFVENPDNYITVGNFIDGNSFLSSYFKDNTDSGSFGLLITSETEWNDSAIYGIIVDYNNNLLVADEWFNFANSNWFVSDNGMYGLLDLITVSLAGMFSAAPVVLYVFTIGALVEVLLVTGTLESGVSSLVKGLKSKEIVLVPTLFILFSLGGTLFGMQEETLGLIPIIIPVLILAGFDASLGYLVVVLGTTTGIASSVLDPFSIGVMADGIGTGISTGIAVRASLFFIYTIIGSLFVTWYALRVRKDPSKSSDSLERIEENKIWAHEVIGDVEHANTLDKKQKWALIIFGITFGWMVFSLLPFGTWIDGLNSSQGWIVFSSVFFNNVLIGQWYFIQLSILFIFVIILISKIFKISNKDILSNSWRATKGLFGVALILIFSRTVSIILSYSGSAETIVNSVFSGVDGGNPVLLSLSLLPLFLVMAIFIPSTSGLAGITAPIIYPIINQISEGQRVVAEIGILAVYPLAQGVINMFSPTTGLVITQAEASRTEYGSVVKWSSGYALTILIVGVISIGSIIAII